jgi:hypothetical protein
MYRTLDSARIVATLEKLQLRVVERFPQGGLANVCAELTLVARENNRRARKLARPNYLLRLLSTLIILCGLALIFFVATQLEVKRDTESIYSTLQGIDSGLNIVLVFGATVIFLTTLEGRWKRQRALGDLDELRSIIHVIDMHQLTKDPASMLAPATPSSPERTMTPGELVRYLDYCSEMLSLAAKVAAVYAQSTKDPQVVSASSDLQQLTANLSAKIWQKIRVAQVSSVDPQRPGEASKAKS